MESWLLAVLILLLTIIFFVVRTAILKNNKIKHEDREESKAIVVYFIRDQFPKTVSVLDVVAYSRIGFQETHEILQALVSEKRIRRQKYRYKPRINELNEYKYCSTTP